MLGGVFLILSVMTKMSADTIISIYFFSFSKRCDSNKIFDVAATVQAAGALVRTSRVLSNYNVTRVQFTSNNGAINLSGLN